MNPAAKTPLLLALMFVSCLAWLPSATAAAPAADPNTAKVAQLLQGSDYEFTKKTASVWVIPKQGKSLGDFKVIGANEGDLLVIFVIIAEKAHMKMSLDLATRMLKMNHEFDQVKIGIDDDGDAFVRADMSIRVLDEEAFKASVEQVAAAADEAYAGIKPYTDYP